MAAGGDRELAAVEELITAGRGESRRDTPGVPTSRLDSSPNQEALEALEVMDGLEMSDGREATDPRFEEPGLFSEETKVVDKIESPLLDPPAEEVLLPPEDDDDLLGIHIVTLNICPDSWGVTPWSKLPSAIETIDPSNKTDPPLRSDDIF